MKKDNDVTTHLQLQLQDFDTFMNQYLNEFGTAGNFEDEEWEPTDPCTRMVQGLPIEGGQF